MATINFEIPCLRCGRPIRGQREPGEHRKEFNCSRCKGHFWITFEHPDLEQDFLNGDLQPNIVPRKFGEPQEDFPEAAIFSSFKRRK